MQFLEGWRLAQDEENLVARSGPGNLNKPLSGESATVDGPTGR
jgi:hypothetical protein